MTQKRNMPSPEGRALGEQLGRLADAAETDMRSKLPDGFPERCASCAFRPGTFPNGCLETVMDALKCTMEGKMFYCHHGKPDAEGRHTDPCIGYLVSRASVYGTEPLEVPWKYSHEYSENNSKPASPT
jgi:hypothetical protein